MATKTVRGMAAEAAYIEDPKERAAFMKFVRSSSNIGKIKAMLEMARDNKGLTAAAETFDTNVSQLVCPNGTLELPIEFSGGVVRRVPSLQHHYNTLDCGTEYHPDASLPEWDKFLARFQPDPEVRAWLQRLAGYSLLGANPRRLMVVCIGDTSTGKSTFAEALSRALGPYAGSANMTIFRDNQDEKPRPDLIRVLPKRFVYAEEASRSWHLHPDQIKRLTGGTPVTARTLQAKVFVDMVPRFTPWLLTNSAPTIEGADAALWRRLVVVPFDVAIPKVEEDATFARLLTAPEGRQAVLAWLVAGYSAYLADPDSVQTIPAGAMVANANFRSEISDLAVCLEEMCEFGEDLYVLPEQLYQAYRAWCTTNGVQTKDILSGTKFGREVNGQYQKHMKKMDGKPVRVRTGIALKPGWLKLAVSY
jgi:putative DNA primase/helicase